MDGESGGLEGALGLAEAMGEVELLPRVTWQSTRGGRAQKGGEGGESARVWDGHIAHDNNAKSFMKPKYEMILNLGESRYNLPHSW